MHSVGSGIFDKTSWARDMPNKLVGQLLKSIAILENKQMAERIVVVVVDLIFNEKGLRRIFQIWPLESRH